MYYKMFELVYIFNIVLKIYYQFCFYLNILYKLKLKSKMEKLNVELDCLKFIWVKKVDYYNVN